ncbi:MAG TPA: thioredoxin [Elusimicrobiota bacterium]|nr:thioredoxin [Elusimicrobiota bacterium]
MANLEVTETSFEKEVLKSDKPVLVDFWAPWCGPCRMLSPVVEELGKEYAGRVEVAKINTDENGELAARYGIEAIPTLLLLKGGKVVERLVGLQPKAEISRALEAALAR